MTTRCLQTASTLFFITKDGTRIALNFIKSTGDFFKQFKDFIANFSSAEVGRKLAAMSEDRRKAFFEDFRDRAATVGAEFDAAPGMVGAWEGLIERPEWVRLNTGLLDKTSKKPNLTSTVDDYYKNAIPKNTPKGFNGEGVYDGVKFNKYGHPELKPHVSDPNHMSVSQISGALKKHWYPQSLSQRTLRL